MLLWLGSYIYVSAYLSTYISMSHRSSDLVFTVFGLTLSATALSKRSTRAQMFSFINILNCLPPLLALCVIKHVCTRLIILTGGKNNKIKIAESGQLAVGAHHFDCKYTFIISKNADRIDCLYQRMGREGVCEKVGPE